MAHVPGRSPFGDKQSSSSFVFEEFVPPSAWTEDSLCHYLLVDLPGFKKQELKLQVDYQTHIIVSGERQFGENKYKRFEQRFELPKNADIEKITGKLDGNILYISVPKKVEQEHKQIKHDNIPSAAPVISDEEKSDANESDSKDGEEDDEEIDHNKDGDNKDLERKKHIMSFDENLREEADLFVRLAMEKLKSNKGIVVIAIFAFSLGVLVTQKLQSDGH